MSIEEIASLVRNSKVKDARRMILVSACDKEEMWENIFVDVINKLENKYIHLLFTETPIGGIMCKSELIEILLAESRLDILTIIIENGYKIDTDLLNRYKLIILHSKSAQHKEKNIKLGEWMKLHNL